MNNEMHNEMEGEWRPEWRGLSRFVFTSSLDRSVEFHLVVTESGAGRFEFSLYISPRGSNLGQAQIASFRAPSGEAMNMESAKVGALDWVASIVEEWAMAANMFFDEKAQKIHEEAQPVALECPFCHNDNVAVNGTSFIASYYVYCNWCGASGPKKDSRKDAIENWNNR